jgi:hypothetical protein
MSLPDNNNAIGGVLGNVKKALKKSNMNKAAAFNRKMDWHNANVFANHQTNRDAAAHTHVTNEGLRVFNTTGQAIKSNKSAGGSNEFYQDSPNAKYKNAAAKKESKASKPPKPKTRLAITEGTSSSKSNIYGPRNNDIVDAEIVEDTPVRTQSNISTPGISYSTPKALNAPSKAIGAPTNSSGNLTAW